MARKNPKGKGCLHMRHYTYKTCVACGRRWRCHGCQTMFCRCEKCFFKFKGNHKFTKLEGITYLNCFPELFGETIKEHVIFT